VCLYRHSDLVLYLYARGFAVYHGALRAAFCATSCPPFITAGLVAVGAPAPSSPSFVPGRSVDDVCLAVCGFGWIWCAHLPRLLTLWDNLRQCLRLRGGLAFCRVRRLATPADTDISSGAHDATTTLYHTASFPSLLSAAPPSCALSLCHRCLRLPPACFAARLCYQDAAADIIFSSANIPALLSGIFNAARHARRAAFRATQTLPPFSFVG